MTAVLDGPPRLSRELERGALFAPCDPDSLRQLAASAELFTKARREIIAPQGKPFPYLGFVHEGVIGVTLNTNGPLRRVSRVRLYEADTHETFGEIGIIDSTAPLGEVTVISKRATYALLPASAVLDLAVQNPPFFQRLASQAVVRARELAQHLALQQGWSVVSRVASVLLRFASEEDGMQPASDQLAHFRQRDIAAAAGCVKEAAARAIAELEERGALRREHGHIRYLDRDELLKYSVQ